MAVAEPSTPSFGEETKQSRRPETAARAKRPILMRPITTARLLFLKFALFLVLGVMAGTLILLRTPSLSSALLLGACVWAFARAYYFCFYVIERYVDRNFRFSGVFAAVRFAWSAARERSVRQ